MCTHTHTLGGGNVWQFYTIFIAYFIIRNKTAKRLKRPRLLLRWGLMQSERRWREREMATQHNFRFLCLSCNSYLQQLFLYRTTSSSCTGSSILSIFGNCILLGAAGRMKWRDSERKNKNYARGRRRRSDLVRLSELHYEHR